ncbi:winged helix-turn-helix domain-containing protein, partial [Rhodoplanes sp. SY1]|uniref:winged helix-turn-helix domain-containing protein n=1 Tax=Rhodoplanes sp. SY1 TaxID=3166646 RepID=UPI0038B5BBCA
MAVPDYQSFMRPLLSFGADGHEKNMNEAIKHLADQFDLSAEDRSQLLPSGKQTILANRVHWAKTYLDKAGALRRTRRSHFQITDRGMRLLADHPERIDAAVLRQFPEFIEFQTPKSDRQSTDAVETEEVSDVPLSSATPDDTLHLAEEAIRATLSAQLLDRIHDLSPAFFERLVVDLIVSMGYAGLSR